MQPTEGGAYAGRASRTWRRLPWALLPAALAVLARTTPRVASLADVLCAWEGYAGVLRDVASTGVILHDGGLMACRIAWLGVVVAWAAAHVVDGLHRHRRRLGRLALSVLVATGIVASLKQLTAVH